MKTTTNVEILNMPSNPSKAKELHAWKTFLASLPPCSYLAMYFADSVPMLEQAMAQDWTCEPVAQIRRGRDEAMQAAGEATAEMRKARDERDAMMREVASLRKTLANVRDELHDACNAAQTLAKQAGEAYQRASQVAAFGMKARVG